MTKDLHIQNLSLPAMKKPFALGLYGKSNSGKTTLLEKLIKRLTEDEVLIATVKISDKLISIDQNGKDTFRHAKAGADVVSLKSKKDTCIILKKNKTLDEILEIINASGEFGLIFVEGANDKKIPKIRIGDISLRENTILTYNNDFEKLINLVKENISRKEDMEKISIKVNGEEITLSEFPSEIIKNTVLGMLKSLKGIEKIKDVEIKLEL